ncbi:GntR family transcriptional regulator [Kumtagia ephedrae]|uniref:GntR family transcriptional regulator n=1 Tax=Kumtagia ephedrae TaxID=2116701 RepID=A0A2P7SJX0_9HYPH|nr:GntR family transcriptional regulator [Mesorhizobium ephedrae]PSJ62651.1 GntR family transcriptional regulator [Mesorhizobium ephedrae]
MNIQPLEQGNLSARAYQALREGLIAGQFRPGQRLVMHDLADQLGTSVTPVREACLRLVSECGLELRSGRFVTVPAMTMARYMEVRTIRLALEGLAAGLAAPNATEDDIARLTDLQAAFVEVDNGGDSERAFRYNRDFHFTVYRLSGMEMLVTHIESLWVSMGPMLTVFFNEGDHRYVGAAEHDNLIVALREKNTAKARTAMERDLILGGEDFLRFLRTHEQFTVD